MARLLIYDAYENKVYTYANLNENDPMPYSTGTTLRVREFRGKSASPTLWTTIAAMEAFNVYNFSRAALFHRESFVALCRFLTGETSPTERWRSDYAMRRKARSAWGKHPGRGSRHS